MHDQAERLRRLVQRQQNRSPRETRIVTITSGKGGVGKSNFTLNFALGLQSRGYESIIFDADIGLANIDVLMGVTPQYSLYNLMKKERNIWEIIQSGHNNLRYVAGGSGFRDLMSLSEDDLNAFADQIEQLDGHVDYILFDTGAGLSKETVKFIQAADETIVVTTPEPTSITDAYAIIKMLHGMEEPVKFKLVINRVTDDREGKQTADKLALVAKRFLGADLPVLGYVPDDANVSKAVKRQIPFSVAYPHTAASRSVEEIVSRYLSGSEGVLPERVGMKSFVRKIWRMIR